MCLPADSPVSENVGFEPSVISWDSLSVANLHPANAWDVFSGHCPRLFNGFEIGSPGYDPWKNHNVIYRRSKPTKIRITAHGSLENYICDNVLNDVEYCIADVATINDEIENLCDHCPKAPTIESHFTDFCGDTAKYSIVSTSLSHLGRNKNPHGSCKSVLPNKFYQQSSSSDSDSNCETMEASAFSQIVLQPPNSILGVALECKKDTYPQKIDLTIGAYRDDNGRPQVLPVVRKAETLLINDPSSNHEYLAQDGLPEFCQAAQVLMFGEESLPISEGRVHTIQGISGTGSIRLAAEFIGSLMTDRICYIPSATWPAHPTILEAARVQQGTYRYLDITGCGLDFDGLVEDLNTFPPNSIVLFHSCAHNPSGVDPTNDQWNVILEVVKARNFLPFFDNAYQGFVSGCPETDAYAVRLFAAAGLEMIVACSFAKNFGLYGERAGCLHFVVADKSTIPAVASQLRVISRSLYSTCPAFGARIVASILNDPQLKEEWKDQCRGMAQRLNGVRNSLFDALVARRVKGTWDHINKQRGMFSYTGIPAWAVQRLRDEYHIYMLSNGRISLAGLNSSNIDRFAEALAVILGQAEPA